MSFVLEICGTISMVARPSHVGIAFRVKTGSGIPSLTVTGISMVFTPVA